MKHEKEFNRSTDQRIKLWVCIACLAMPWTLFSQERTSKLSLDLVAGAQPGWWVFNRGSTSPEIFNDLGWDRTDNKITLSVGGTLLYHWGRLKVGAGVDHARFLETFMEAFEDTDSNRRIFRISNGAVTFWKYFLQTEFEVLRKKNYVLSPNIKLGSFDIQTLHPDRENFGEKRFLEIGLVNEVTISGVRVIIRPEFRSMTIRSIQRSNFNELHNIKGFGMSIGVRLPLLKSKTIQISEDASL